MYHDSIRTGSNKRSCPLQCILHALLKNQAFDSGDDHEVICQLSLFTSCNLFTKFFNRRLGLLNLSTEERILLKSLLILDDYCRNAHSFQTSHSIHKMLCQSAGITVKNDRFCSNFHNIVNGAEAAGHIHQFNVWFTFCRAVTQGTDPHSVKLIQLSVFPINNRFLYNQSRQSGVSLHCLHNRSHLNQLTKSLSPVFRHGELFLQLLIYLFNALTICIGHIDDLAAIGIQQMFDMIPNSLLCTYFPIVPMYHIVRMKLFDCIIIEHVAL